MSAATALCSLLLLVATMPVRAGELEESRSQLAEIERRIEQASAELTGKQAAAGDLNAELGKVERERVAIESRIARLREREASLEVQLAEKQAEVNRTREAVEERQAMVRKRLAALYKSGDMGFMRILFAPEAPARRAEKYDYLGRIVRRDRQIVAAYRTEVAAHEEAMERLRDSRDEQKRVLDRLAGERRTLASAEEIKRKLLVRLRRDEAAINARLEELRAAAERLEALIKKLESATAGRYTQPAGDFAQRRGELPWPFAGEVVSAFGRHRHPELGTLVDSRGLEVAVAADEPLRAVWPGRVIYADSFPGYDNLLIIDHGEGYYTLYAKAARLTKRVGDRVSAGETIAHAGPGRQESLYFEIRHRGTPLDPDDWLSPR